MELREKTCAEFFSGIGLMRLGLERAGWSVRFANDIDADKCAMYRDHFGPSPELHRGDIHQLADAAIPEVALATASFPCTDLSLAGARGGLAGKHSSAFWGFIQVLKNMTRRRPPLVLLENVPGFLTSNDGADFRAALLALNRVGYAVDTFMIDAARFVPQSRQRLFVVGTKTARGARLRPALDVAEGHGRPSVLADFIRLHPEIQWSVRALPALPQTGGQVSDIVEEIETGSPIWWSPERALYLLNQMSEKHRARADAMIAGGGLAYGTVFRRKRSAGSMAELRIDGRAGCLRTPRGGSGRQILFAAGRGGFAARLLTPRECARLMGAGEFTIKASSTQALFGFGDAVCVPVIEWIARHYLDRVWEEKFAGVTIAA